MNTLPSLAYAGENANKEFVSIFAGWLITQEKPPLVDRLMPSLLFPTHNSPPWGA
jgi:hypothetical protein